MPDTFTLPAPLSIWQLANLADCGSPDVGDGIGQFPPRDPDADYAPPSPGAVFLRSVEDAVRERFEDYPDGIDGDGEWVHEVADGAPSVYTHTRWAEFVDLAAYQEDASELGASADDLTAAAGVALYMIAERLCLALAAEYAPADEDDDE